MVRRPAANYGLVNQKGWTRWLGIRHRVRSGPATLAPEVTDEIMFSKLKNLINQRRVPVK
jgi:hypothetical protein